MLDFKDYNDYMSNLYVQDVVMQNSTGRIQWIKPFIGSLAYPSSVYPNGLASQQNKQTVYVGHLDMLFPSAITTINADNKPSYTKLTFALDGIERQIIQIGGATVTDGLGTTFEDFIFGLNPYANKEFSFNKSAVHLLGNVIIEGAQYDVLEGSFEVIDSGLGVFNDSYEFHISIGGYSVLIQ